MVNKDFTKAAQEAADLKAALRRQQDFADLQNESAGRNTGRMRRFSPATDRLDAEVKTSDYLLFVQATRAVYDRMDRIRDRIEELDRIAARLQSEAERKALERQEELERLRARATVNRYGKRVYMTADTLDGYYEDGTRMTRREFALQKWQRLSPTWEQYRQTDDRLQQVIEEHERLTEFRERLRVQKERVTREEPLRDVDMDAIERDLEQMPDSVRNALERGPGTQHSAAHGYMPDDGFTNAPNATAEFNRAGAKSAPRPQNTSAQTSKRPNPNNGIVN